MPYLSPLISISGFVIIALASKQIGAYLRKMKLPLISGFLLTGIIAGPYVLGLIPTEALPKLRFIDDMALGFIAFAAGAELYLKDLRDRYKSITWVTVGLVISTFTLGSLTILFLAQYIPFMRSLPLSGRVAIAILGGAILVARSPSSAIAIVNELRAYGPFTRTALGVTVIMDVVVIILFAINASAADALLTNMQFNLGFIGLLSFELLFSLILGYLLYRILLLVFSSRLVHLVKMGLVLGLGYSVFVLSEFLRAYSHNNLPFEVLVEPLLICMIAGFLVSSFSDYRAEFAGIVEEVGPAIYVMFFTLTGASLALDILVQTWEIALALFAVRLLGIFIGSFSGGIAAGDPMKHNRVSWMAYVTQAGVGLGLAKEVAGEFPEWGAAFATVIISVIVLNQIVGPPFFKWVIQHVGEAHPRAQTPEFDGVRDAIIFGVTAESVTLARRLIQHDWQVKLACAKKSAIQDLDTTDMDLYLINDNSHDLMDDITLETLRELQADCADAIISFLPDDLSYQVCELAYEHFGTETLVVRLKERTNCDIFSDLGVKVVEPRTALVSLLEHSVISPSGTALLLGSEDGQEIVDIEMRNPQLDGVALRDLRLPMEALVLSIHRDEQMLVPHGYVQFHLGDKITMVCPKDKLEEVILRLEQN